MQITLSKAENRLAALGDELAGTKSRRETTVNRIKELSTELEAVAQKEFQL